MRCAFARSVGAQARAVIYASTQRVMSMVQRSRSFVAQPGAAV